jgi:hypothetical protein
MTHIVTTATTVPRSTVINAAREGIVKHYEALSMLASTEPTNQQLDELWHELLLRDSRLGLNRRFARAVLERWGIAAPATDAEVLR